MSLLAHHSPLLSTSAAETCGSQFRRERGAAVLLISEDLDEILERPPILIPRQLYQPVEIDMLRYMRGEFVERAFDRRFIGEVRADAERQEPGRALGIGGEQPVGVGAHHQPVLRNRAVLAPVRVAQQRTGGSWARRPPDVHFIPLEAGAIGEARSSYGDQR